MTEDFQPPVPERSRPNPSVEGTGNAAVDDTLETLDGLESAPVSEHVAVFESAHERLRDALSDAGS